VPHQAIKASEHELRLLAAKMTMMQSMGVVVPEHTSIIASKHPGINIRKAVPRHDPVGGPPDLLLQQRQSPLAAKIGFEDLIVFGRRPSSTHHAKLSHWLRCPMRSMLASPRNRRSFDCAPLDQAARGFAQDDSLIGVIRAYIDAG
jgi:hypothetical protein